MLSCPNNRALPQRHHNGGIKISARRFRLAQQRPTEVVDRHSADWALCLLMVLFPEGAPMPGLFTVAVHK